MITIFFSLVNLYFRARKKWKLHIMLMSKYYKTRFDMFFYVLLWYTKMSANGPGGLRSNPTPALFSLWFSFFLGQPIHLNERASGPAHWHTMNYPEDESTLAGSPNVGLAITFVFSSIQLGFKLKYAGANSNSNIINLSTSIFYSTQLGIKSNWLELNLKFNSTRYRH